MNGYEEAKKHDEEICEKIRDNPITPQNATEWLTFSRAVKKQMDILENHCKQIITAETKRIINERKNEPKSK